MVVACLALTVSLSGVGYAASVLPSNSVGTAQLKNGAITSTKVRNGSLLRADFKAGQLLGGAPGLKGERGERGEPGSTGERGPKGEQGPRGPNGVVSAYTTPGAADGIYRAVDGSVIARLTLPAGRYVIFGRVLIASLTGAQRPPTFYAYCRLTAGDDSDYDQVRGHDNGVIPAPVTLIHEFRSSGAAELRCSDSSNEASTWARARITAVQVTGTSIHALPTNVDPGPLAPLGNG